MMKNNKNSHHLLRRKLYFRRKINFWSRRNVFYVYRRKYERIYLVAIPVAIKVFCLSWNITLWNLVGHYGVYSCEVDVSEEAIQFSSSHSSSFFWDYEYVWCYYSFLCPEGLLLSKSTHSTYYYNCCRNYLCLKMFFKNGQLYICEVALMCGILYFDDMKDIYYPIFYECLVGLLF